MSEKIVGILVEKEQKNKIKSTFCTSKASAKLVVEWHT